VRRGRKPTAGQGRSPEAVSFAAGGMAGEMLAALHGLGPRDLKLIGVLIARVREVEAERGEAAARDLIEAIADILVRQGLTAT
jgi:hypothetical protein